MQGLTGEAVLKDGDMHVGLAPAGELTVMKGLAAPATCNYTQ